MALNGDTVTNSPSSLHAGGHVMTNSFPHSLLTMFCLASLQRSLPIMNWNPQTHEPYRPSLLIRYFGILTQQQKTDWDSIIGSNSSGRLYRLKRHHIVVSDLREQSLRVWGEACPCRWLLREDLIGETALCACPILWAVRMYWKKPQCWFDAWWVDAVGTLRYYCGYREEGKPFCWSDMTLAGI